MLAVRRGAHHVANPLDHVLASGDAMLVIGPWKRIRKLQSALHDFLVLALPSEIEDVAPEWRRAPLALAIVGGMVALSVAQAVPVVVAVLLAALLAVVTRCLTMEQAYRAVHWGTIVLIAGMMSVARALEKTGVVEVVVNGLVAELGWAGPYVMMSAIFFSTVGLSAVLSSTSGAIVLAPIAVAVANATGVTPHAMTMAVAIAASSAYVFPTASSLVMLVVGPGNYRFRDFARVGLPMLVMTWLVTLVMAPALFPFRND
ncbi:MAG: anion permease [Dehalococcoidia bacterium]|nr:anion permease [Dehalococcoidia bacterium]